MNDKNNELAFWKQKSKKTGNIYYSAKIPNSDEWVVLYDNREDKKNPKAPDFKIIFPDGFFGQVDNSNLSHAEEVLSTNSSEVQDDDIPF